MAISVSSDVVSIEELRRFTAEEFDCLVELGMLGDEERVEFLEGILVSMTPIGDEHEACVDRLNELLGARLGGRAQVRIPGRRLDQRDTPSSPCTRGLTGLSFPGFPT